MNRKEVIMRKLHLTIAVLLIAVFVAAVPGCGTPAKVVTPDHSAQMVFAAEEAARLGVIWSQQDVGLWVNGEGEATALPDVAVLQLGVETQRQSLLEAQREAADAMDALMKVFKSNGIADRDIQTQRYSIYPVRRWNENENREELIGYRVTNTVVAKIRKIDQAGKVIDTVAAAAGDTTRIEGINFTVDDPTAYYEEARKKAVKNAQDKARQIADEAGIKLGKPIYISEGTVYSPVMRDMFAKAEGAAPSQAPTPISPGELEYRINVQIVYEIN
jgi:uncharacterized protein YggE